ncbi:MAG: acyl-CoA desaturase [Chloroflexi bacterium]|nr:MAG: acyl-CoA desaturase [Chloroflexota bacterium]TMG00105.1 MAG: acyl-CoA desaturase [Chloroflexota bacterium]
MVRVRSIDVIATTSSPIQARVAQPYAELKRRVEAAGLMNKRPGYYVLMLATNAILFGGTLWLLTLVQSVWATALVAAALGVVSGQLGFQLHDSGHRQMFPSRRLNTVVGIATGNGLLGMSHGWWVDKHNRHHGNPNHVDLDPDIDIGVIAYSEEQAVAKRGFARWVVRHQAGLFFVLILGLAWTMHLKSVQFLVSTRDRLRWVEAGALCFHALAFPALLVLIVGPWRALLVIVLQKCVGGFYLASVFAPNHKGMPQIEKGEELDFLRSQVLTSRNVRSNPITDLLYGSLNYQIEHHLFPTMPRCNIRRAHKIVRDYCAELGVPYHETSIYRSYREILSFLHEVGAPLRTAPA